MPDAPVDSWRMFYDPAVVSKFKDCGVTILDAPSEVVGTVLIYLGKDANSEDPEDLKAAEQVLMKIRPYVRSVNSSAYIDDLANGEVCLSLGWVGDVLQARDRANEAGKGLTIDYNIPKEGAVMLLRHAGDPGGRQAPAQRASLHRLPAAARRGGEELQFRQLREQQRRLLRARQGRREERHEHLSARPK